MRIVFLLLLAANIVFFSIHQGYFGNLLKDGRDPQRISKQVDTERIKILADQKTELVDSGSAAAPSEPAPQIASNANAAPPTSPTVATTEACVELGGFLNEELKSVEPLLTKLELGSRVTTRKTGDQPTYVVYLPPFKSKAEADRAAAELRRFGVSDFYVIQDNSPLRLAISLGVFKTEDGAKTQATALSQKGVRNARVAPRPATVPRTWYQVHDVDAELRTKISEIQQHFPAASLQSC